MSRGNPRGHHIDGFNCRHQSLTPRDCRVRGGFVVSVLSGMPGYSIELDMWFCVDKTLFIEICIRP